MFEFKDSGGKRKLQKSRTISTPCESPSSVSSVRSVAGTSRPMMKKQVSFEVLHGRESKQAEMAPHGRETKREGRKAKEERKAEKHERISTRRDEELTGEAKGRVGKCGLQSGRPRARAPSKQTRAVNVLFV